MTEEAILKISGMHCTSCARLIEHSLKREDGVESVTVDYSSEEASVEFDSARLETGSLKQLIHGLGYEVVDEQHS